MGFKLESIDMGARRKISQNMAENEKYRVELKRIEREGSFPDVWAVDFNADSYLILAPKFMREDGAAQYYYFYCESVFYKFFIGSLWSESVESSDHDFNVACETLDFNEKLKAAFEVFGRFGKGALNELGETEYSIAPKFEGAK